MKLWIKKCALSVLLSCLSGVTSSYAASPPKMEMPALTAQVIANPDTVRPVTPSVSIQTQATAMRHSADSMRTLGTQKLPDGLTQSQIKDAKQYQAWLLASAKRFDQQAAQGEKLVRASAGSVSKEASMSFHLQYLELQSRMQHENRSYTTISNIMKAKHDATKNAINNVR